MVLDPDTQQKLNDHYQPLVKSLSARQFRETVKQMKAIFDLIPDHPNFVSSVVQHIMSTGLDRREFMRVLDLFIRTYPSDPSGHLLKNIFYYNHGTLEQLRQSWQNAVANMHQGFHFQPNTQASVFDAEQGHPHTRMGTPGLGERIKETLNLSVDDLALPHTIPDTHHTDQPACETLPAEPIESSTVALNGTLTGLNDSGVYYFRYGHDPGDLDQKTQARSIPGPLNGYVRDLGSNIFRTINNFGAETTFADAGDIPVSELPQPVTKMSLAWPFGKDRNHKDGIGVIDLVLGWQSAAHDRPPINVEVKSPKYPSATYPGESLDLSDAVVSIVYRTIDFDPRDFRPVIWIHGRTGTAAFPDSFNDLAAWAVTGDGDSIKLERNSDWQHLEFKMPAHSDMWSFCGSNTEEMGDSMVRYCYAPIQELLRENKSGNICLCFVNGDELETPSGEIEIASIELKYRSRSLLAPGQGASLIAQPDDALGDPALLTDGTIRVPEHWWHTHISENQPCVLAWALRERVPVESIKLHQNPLAPASDVNIAVSDDGENFKQIWAGQLDDVSPDPSAWADAVVAGEGSGLCRIIVLDTPAPAKFLRLTILNGHQKDIAGLDAVEAFASDAAPVPSGEQVTCSELVEGLSGNRPLYAQLVAECGEAAHEGNVVRCDLPNLDSPQILAVRLAEQDENNIVLHVRTRAGGSTANLNVSVESDDGTKLDSSVVDVGKWHAARDSIIRLESGDASPARIKCDIRNSHDRDSFTLDL